MGRFDGKVALVTGAGNGIGAAVATALGREGAAVACFDFQREAVDATAAAIGERAVALEGDTRDNAAVEVAVRATVDAFGGVDLLVPVAGVLALAPLDEHTEEVWDRNLNTNAKGPFLFVMHAVPQLRARGGGAIVLAGSAMAYTSTAAAAAYSASKGAIVAMTNSLALELAPDGIRVNAVAPGTVRTPMMADMIADPDLGPAIAAAHPIGRLIEADEVAELILFLLSDAAGAITGSCHRVDGGLISKLPI